MTGKASEFLNPFAPPGAKPKVFRIPCFDSSPNAFIKFVLNVLNRKHEEKLADYLGFLLVSDDSRGAPLATPEFKELIRSIEDVPDIFDCAVKSFSETLRDMTDMWIDSGKSAMNQHMDSALDRNVKEVLPGREISLLLWIDRLFLRTHANYMGMRPDGSIGIKKQFPRFDWVMHKFRKHFDALGNLDALKGYGPAMEEYGQMLAAFNMTNLLNSPYSRRVSRCDHCKQYFVYTRARLSAVKNGAHCPQCIGKASVVRTEASRAKRIETAAKEWVRLESKHKGQPEFERIADEVNKSHGTAFGRRWVSQNLAEIQKTVEALRNGKG
jgi:hypothetical protein